MDLDDKRRLSVLRDYRVLDTPDEEPFDNITRLTARIFHAPVALVTLVDEYRQWFKSRTGTFLRESPREHSFCAHAVHDEAPFVVRDASTDERFKTNPLVTGEPFVRFYCGVPLRAPTGEPLGTLCIIDRVARDITGADIELLESLARQVTLEMEIRRRLALVEEALVKQERARECTEQLAAMVVHDLRNPLAVLSMMTALVRPADEESRQTLADMLDEAERMRRMLGDVLDICIHRAGTMNLRLGAVDLTAIVERVTNRLRRTAAHAVQNLVLDLPPRRVLMRADPELIERVVENLVGNAISHGPQGETIAVRLRFGTGARARVDVCDLGTTLPADARDRIFAAFERGAAGVESSHRGYGLGLAFCRLAVEAHGGRIGVVPNGDRGNCFYFELPDGAAESAAARCGSRYEQVVPGSRRVQSD